MHQKALCNRSFVCASPSERVRHSELKNVAMSAGRIGSPKQCTAKLLAILRQDQVIVEIEEKEPCFGALEQRVHIAAPSQPLLMLHYLDAVIFLAETPADRSRLVFRFVDGDQDPQTPIGLPLSATQRAVDKVRRLVRWNAHSHIGFPEIAKNGWGADHEILARALQCYSGSEM